jgi:NTP pyrophosphatase (non-canonical NTP hydrolase)
VVALGFVGDVGDLMKLVQAMEGVRAIPDAPAKLAHELADCLWSVMTLARLYDIDLEAAFASTMDELERDIEDRLTSEQPGERVDEIGCIAPKTP